MYCSCVSSFDTWLTLCRITTWKNSRQWWKDWLWSFTTKLYFSYFKTRRPDPSVTGGCGSLTLLFQLFSCASDMTEAPLCWMKSGGSMFWCGRRMPVPTARTVSDGGPDPAGIFSGGRSQKVLDYVTWAHTPPPPTPIPPSLMPVCHLIAALRTMMHCGRHALELRFNRLLTPLASTQRMKDDHTVGGRRLDYFWCSAAARWSSWKHMWVIKFRQKTLDLGLNREPSGW